MRQRPSSALNITGERLRIGTWNVRTLLQTGKLNQLIRNADQYRMDILGVQEVRWTGRDSTKVEDWELFYSGRDDNQHIEGVGLLLSQKARRALLMVEFVNERLMRARFRAKHTNLTVVVAYGPTEDKNDADKDMFMAQLDEVIGRIPKHDLIVLAGDLNAKVGGDHMTWPAVIGKFGIGEMNNNGQRVLELCAQNGLLLGATHFQHKDIHKYTWKSPDGKIRNQIDHIIVNRKWKRSLKNVRTYRGADINSDHELVVADVQLSLLQSKKKQRKTVKYADAKLTEEETAHNFDVQIGGRFSALGAEVGDSEKEWKTFKESVLETAEQLLGREEQVRKKQWVSNGTLELLKQRQAAKINSDEARSEINRRRYQKLDEEVKRSYKKDKANWIAQKTADLEKAAGHGDQKALYRLVNELTGSKRSNVTQLRDKKGELLENAEKRLNRWAEYFNELLNNDNPSNPAADVIKDQQLQNNAEIVTEIDTGTPTLSEVQHAIKQLNANKAPGFDQVTARMLKHGGLTVAVWLRRVIVTVWESEVIPEDWKKGVIIPLPKKGDRTYCSNNRGITLLSIAGKVFCKVVLNRIKDMVDANMRENQAGFRKQRSCQDQLFSLRQIIEKCEEYQIPCAIHFVDFKAAFDSVHRTSLWVLLREYGIPEKIIALIRNTYDGAECCVRAEGDFTYWFKIVTGVRQGCIWSPLLFGIIMDWVLRRSQDSKNHGVTLNPRRSSRYPEWRLPDLDFADDIALFGNSSTGLIQATEDLENVGASVGLSLNYIKCKVMFVGSTYTQGQLQLNNGNSVEVVEHFKYLGSTCCRNGSVDKEVNVRIARAAEVFKTLEVLWKDHSISLATKMGVYSTSVLSALLYSSETWALTKTNEKRLDSFDQRCLRKIMRVNWTMKVTNEEIRRKAGRPALSQVIKNHRLRWLGHVLRMSESRIPKQLLKWRPTHGKRRRGRPRLRWEDIIMKDIQEWDLDMKSAEVTAQDRSSWMRLVTTARAAALNAT